MHVNISAKLKMLNSNYPYLFKRLLVHIKRGEIPQNKCFAKFHLISNSRKY